LRFLLITGRPAWDIFATIFTYLLWYRVFKPSIHKIPFTRELNHPVNLNYRILKTTLPGGRYIMVEKQQFVKSIREKKIFIPVFFIVSGWGPHHES
jgi:hypothetical protein